MDENIKKLVERSGIPSHLKTTNILREKGWPVLVSPYYHDSISDSIRETDLVAEKQFNTGHGSGSSVHLNVQLFIECKYIKQEVVFWFDNLNKQRAVMALEEETGLDIVYAGYKHSGDITPAEFHYLKDESVAKLFSTNLSQEDVIYKAMNQCLHSQLYYRRRGKRPINQEFNAHPKAHTQVIQFPVIVCDNFSNLLRLKAGVDEEYQVENLQNHFILEVNYREDYFLIDIVDINYFSTFLDEFEQEAGKLVNAYAGKIRL